jgi:hypothetical protein
MHFVRHDFGHGEQALQLQDFTLDFRLLVLGVFVGAAFANVACFLRLVYIISNFFSFYCA